MTDSTTWIAVAIAPAAAALIKWGYAPIGRAFRRYLHRVLPDGRMKRALLAETSPPEEPSSASDTAMQFARSFAATAYTWAPIMEGDGPLIARESSSIENDVLTVLVRHPVTEGRATQALVVWEFDCVSVRHRSVFTAIYDDVSTCLEADASPEDWRPTSRGSMAALIFACACTDLGIEDERAEQLAALDPSEKLRP